MLDKEWIILATMISLSDPILKRSVKELPPIVEIAQLMLVQLLGR